MSNICVAHLVRERNGIEPFRRFLESYRANPGGVEHDLVLLCKGFRGDRLPEEYLEALAGLEYIPLFFPDAGYDIKPYLATPRRIDRPHYCMVNSYSILRDPEWLAKLYQYATQPGVGIVGVSGSWGSVYSYFLNEMPEVRSKPLHERGLHRFRLLRYRRYFDTFPNVHVRTNAFLVPRDVILRIKCLPLLRKLDALRFESGKDSMTQQIRRSGGRALIVGRDGRAYEEEAWACSDTFWQRDQANLLVSDNRTEQYRCAEPAMRERLSRFAWGPHACPMAAEDTRQPCP